MKAKKSWLYSIYTLIFLIILSGCFSNEEKSQDEPLTKTVIPQQPDHLTITQYVKDGVRYDNKDTVVAKELPVDTALILK
ncbi:hypothetical protein FNH22_05335 [Fulvivirga sp. M361]|uniref:hypothetical protein n=1 Tax=Fulvivirga sp. M361 TaxID=2594266 RepID=UPI00117A11D5|nr:hypothetical protein [Fulvivirga sp. M361]TRX60475.1 hypothetical protein FNH22_05335 [Fulvivirga sp. M361]